MKKIFIIGTDTEIGKTYCTQLLLRTLRQANKTVIGVKPIASGATWKNNQFENEDALKLMAESSIQLPYAMHNPFVFAAPYAANIAARQHHLTLTVDDIIQRLQPVVMSPVDVILFEGAGGLLNPLNDTQLFSDLIYAMQVPTVLIVDLKLGCMNHTLLTLDAMTNRNVLCLGWIANHCQQETKYSHLMLEDLKKRLPVPHLLTIGHNQMFLPQAHTDPILHFFL